MAELGSIHLCTVGQAFHFAPLPPSFFHYNPLYCQIFFFVLIRNLFTAPSPPHPANDYCRLAIGNCRLLTCIFHAEIEGSTESRVRAPGLQAESRRRCRPGAPTRRPEYEIF